MKIRMSCGQTKKSARRMQNSRQGNFDESKVASSTFQRKDSNTFLRVGSRAFSRCSRDLFSLWPCVRANRMRFPLSIFPVDQTDNLFLKSFRRSSSINFSPLFIIELNLTRKGAVYTAVHGRDEI